MNIKHDIANVDEIYTNRRKRLPVDIQLPRDCSPHVCVVVSLESKTSLRARLYTINARNIIILYIYIYIMLSYAVRNTRQKCIRFLSKSGQLARENKPIFHVECTGMRDIPVKILLLLLYKYIIIDLNLFALLVYLYIIYVYI